MSPALAAPEPEFHYPLRARRGESRPQTFEHHNAAVERLAQRVPARRGVAAGLLGADLLLADTGGPAPATEATPAPAPGPATVRAIGQALEAGRARVERLFSEKAALRCSREAAEAVAAKALVSMKGLLERAAYDGTPEASLGRTGAVGRRDGAGDDDLCNLSEPAAASQLRRAELKRDRLELLGHARDRRVAELMAPRHENAGRGVRGAARCAGRDRPRRTVPSIQLLAGLLGGRGHRRRWPGPSGRGARNS